MPPPPGLVTTTVAVPVPPEQRLVPTEQSPFDVIVMRLGRSGAGRTVIEAVEMAPAESCTLIDTPVSAATFDPSRRIDPPATDCETGSTAELLEKAKKGPTPPVTVNVVGTPEYTMAVEGSTVSGPGTGGVGA